MSGQGAPRPVTPVGILAELLTGLQQRLGGTSIDARSRAELLRATELAVGLEGYSASCTTAESPALQALSARTAAEDWTSRSRSTPVRLEQEMLSGHVEGQTLKFLVRLGSARRVLEIGMFTGYSALAMAEALPSDGQLVALELDAGVAEIAQAAFGDSPHGKKIEIRIGPALQTLEELAMAREPFDFVFIDADKAGYADYLNYLLASGLLADGGVICVDNTMLQGEPWLSGESSANGAAIEAFNQQVVDDCRVEQVLLPVRDGLTLIRRVEEEL